MPVLVSFTLPADAFAFAAAVNRDRDLRVHFDRVVPVGDTALPSFWLTRGDRATFEDAVADDPAVDRLNRVESTDGRHRYRARWAGDDDLLAAVIEADATMLEARLNDGIWSFRLRFDEAAETKPFHRRCHEHEIPVDITRVVTLDDADERAEYGLTERQHETLVAAYEAGYFKRPREATLADLSAELGVTEQAVSRRIGLGLDALLGASIAHN
ncbi:helix-turn-helix domain-containing protein [Halobaculum limi]|uniref:helix-turn-helix domain-containing protein n=1 Tax=Halobaculum limi TaxID=3031916 RepID=UPI0024066BCC|nr:helix-turn-helix domain-containing protein [Halobaculum sp. YSMS11]